MWHFHSPIHGNLRQQPTKNASRSLVLYGSMIADDFVTQRRVATLIKALAATLVALSRSSTETSLKNDDEQI
jgi:hypothetical protein